MTTVPRASPWGYLCCSPAQPPSTAPASQFSYLLFDSKYSLARSVNFSIASLKPSVWAAIFSRARLKSSLVWADSFRTPLSVSEILSYLFARVVKLSFVLSSEFRQVFSKQSEVLLSCAQSFVHFFGKRSVFYLEEL